MSDFDDIFKSRLYDNEAELPDDMWSRIEQEAGIKSGGNKKKVILFSAMSIVIISTIIGFYFYNNETPIITPEIKQNSNQLLVSKDAPNSLSNFLKASPEAINSSNPEAKNQLKEQLIEKAKVIPPISRENNISINKENSSQKVSSINNYFIESSVKNTKTHHLISTNNYLVENLKLTINPIKADLAINTLPRLPEYENKCPKFGKSRTGFFSVDFYHSNDYNLRHIQAKSDDFSYYEDLRINTESSVYSYSDGARIRWYSNSGFGIGFGLERSRINERFSFTDNNAFETKTLITLDTIFGLDGSYTTSSDTTRIEVSGSRTNIISNSYTSIDLPLSLTYQIELNKWAIALNAGVNINLLFSQKGRILGINGKPNWINSGPANEIEAYQPKSGLKFDGSVSIIYHLTPNLDIMAEPYFRYNNNSLTLEKYVLDHYYNTIGLRTGIRYNFGF